jgi:hypothetical protein
MKNQTEVQMRLQGLIVEELDRRVTEAQKRLPHLCMHNHQQGLDSKRTVDGEPNPGFNRTNRINLPVVNTIGLCMLGVEDPFDWNGTICDDPIDAQLCPQFTPQQTKKLLFDEFREQLKDFSWVKANFPEMHALLWVLDDIPANYHLPWWKRLAFWFLRVRIEPMHERDVLKLLPPGELDDVHGP